MFVKKCDNESPHARHVHVMHWVRDELPLIPTHVAITLPDEWDATYLCHGIKEHEPSWQVSGALEMYRYHTWDSTSRKCGCGDLFEASLVGHTTHDQHRMLEVLVSVGLSG